MQKLYLKKYFKKYWSQNIYCIIMILKDKEKHC